MRVVCDHDQRPVAFDDVEPGKDGGRIIGSRALAGGSLSFHEVIAPCNAVVWSLFSVSRANRGHRKRPPVTCALTLPKGSATFDLPYGNPRNSPGGGVFTLR